MVIIALAAIDKIVKELYYAYPDVLMVSGIIGAMLGILVVHEKLYALIGLFFTRKFKQAEKLHKYAILIPARNEENVIANLIDSIYKQDYPRELITIFVVADNCTDNTAQLARENGAICYEHINPQERTKGFALKYLFEQIKNDYGIDAYEGYFIFDADNLLNKDYITRMNDSFDAGEKIITSYRNTKNLSENWIASTYALHWIRTIRYRHRARSFLRLTTNIQGTGFLVSSEVVKDGWKYTSLTEDRAFTTDCVINGYRISYNDKAMFFDEQPANLKISLRQRLRWSKGYLQSFKEGGAKLLLNILVDRNTKKSDSMSWFVYLQKTIRNRWISYDTFAQLLPKSVVSAVRFIVVRMFFLPCVCYAVGIHNMYLLYDSSYVSIILERIFGNIVINMEPGIKAYFICLLMVIWWRIIYRIGRYFINILTAVYLFAVERKRLSKINIFKKIYYCFMWPVFDIIGKYSQYAALFMKVEWKPIPHNSKLTIDDLSN